MLCGGLHDAADGPHQLVPAGRLLDQLLPACRREAVVPRLAVVLRGSPKRRDPSTVLKPVQGRIKGAVLDLQNVLGAALDRVCDGLAVGRSEYERLEDQHVEGPLDHFGLQRRLTSWHTC